MADPTNDDVDVDLDDMDLADIEAAAAAISDQIMEDDDNSRNNDTKNSAIKNQDTTKSHSNNTSPNNYTNNHKPINTQNNIDNIENIDNNHNNNNNNNSNNYKNNLTNNKENEKKHSGNDSYKTGNSHSEQHDNENDISQNMMHHSGLHQRDGSHEQRIDLLSTLQRSDDYDNNVDNSSDLENGTKCQRFCNEWFHIGNISNMISCIILLIGLLLRIIMGNNNSIVCYYILSLGLFAFAGGVTNWLAVKMLFDKIPLLYGSGVIPRRFVEIRIAVKQIFMANFFDENYLKEYLNKRIDDLNIEQKLITFCDSADMSQIIDRELGKIGNNPLLTMMLAASGMANAKNLLPMMKPFIITMAKNFVPELKKQLMSKENLGSFLDVQNFRDEMDKMLDDRLQYLDDKAVKKLMEHVIRKHLYWLIVWGNVFGGLIGLICAILKIP